MPSDRERAEGDAIARAHAHNAHVPMPLKCGKKLMRTTKRIRSEASGLSTESFSAAVRAEELVKRAAEFSKAFGCPVDVGDVFNCERCGRFLPLGELQLTSASTPSVSTRTTLWRFAT